jgi:amidase
VRDAQIGLQAIVGSDVSDRFTAEADEHVEDWSKCLVGKDALKGMKFGLPIKRMWEKVDDNLKPEYEQLFEKIKDAGGQIIPVDFPCWERMIDEKGWAWNEREPHESEFHVCAVEFYNGSKDYLKELTNTDIKSLEDIIAWNEKHNMGARPGDLPGFPNGHDYLETVVKTKGVRDETYYNALKFIREQTRDRGFDAIFKEHPELDCLIVPDRRGSAQQLAAQAGYPIIAIPVGVDEEKGGRPFGISFHHMGWNEAKIIRAAAAVEDLIGGAKARPRPEYREYTATNIPVIP